jgi:ABC-2 type transport system ATP-binding protein
MLELQGLTKRYDGVVALDGLTLAVPPGRLFGLLGPNGAGKSTAMRIVFGLLRPDGGEVRWRDRVIGAEQRLHFGYLPEERGLYPKMRVRDQLVYFGRLHDMSRRDAGASADRWLERLGVADRAGDKVDELSLGNQQRVQLAAALVHGPDLLVLDEPFSGLDPVAVDTLAAVLAERAAAGASVIFSSHQLDLVEDLCDSVAIVDHGRVVLAGRVRELKQSGPRLLRVQLERPYDGSWADGLRGASPAGTDARGTRLALDPGVDALDVLAQVRAAGRVVDFGLELPRLSQLFRAAVAA